jgi:hypothetical protein
MHSRSFRWSQSRTIIPTKYRHGNYVRPPLASMLLSTCTDSLHVDLKYAQFLTLYGLFEANRWRESQGRNTAAKQKQEGEADNLTCVIWKEK